MGVAMNMLVVEAESGASVFRVGDSDELTVNFGASNPATSSVIRIDSTVDHLHGELSLMPSTHGQSPHQAFTLGAGGRKSITLDNNVNGEQTFMVQVSLSVKGGDALYTMMFSVTNTFGDQNRCRCMAAAMWS